MVRVNRAVTLDYEDTMAIKAKGDNISQICRLAIKAYLGKSTGKKNEDIVNEMIKEKLGLLKKIDDLTVERDDLRKKYERAEQRAKAKRIVYR